MNEDRLAVEERFYRTCAELLGATHQYSPWTGRPPNRWNNRRPGNGRFPGFGTIRMFGQRSVHVSLRHPFVLNRHFTSVDEATAYLASRMR